MRTPVTVYVQSSRLSIRTRGRLGVTTPDVSRCGTDGVQEEVGRTPSPVREYRRTPDTVGRGGRTLSAVLSTGVSLSLNRRVSRPLVFGL